VASLTAPVALRAPGRFIAWVALAPALLLVAHLLPATGFGLALRLAAAAACVLLVPGALVLRAVGWSASPATAVAGAFVVSLAVVALGLALVFALGASIILAELVLLTVALAALVPAARRKAEARNSRTDSRALAAVLGLSVVYAGVVWWGARPARSDGLFHLARVRKLAEFDSLGALTTVDEFKDGGLHPGYVFPLWHGMDALISRLAGVDSTEVLLHLPAVLVPLAVVLAYAAGSEVFRSPFGGLAFVLAEVGYFGFLRRDGGAAATGRFETLPLPQSATLMLLATAVIALAFAFAIEGGLLTWLCLAAASFALSAIHISYTPMLILVLAGFLVARAILIRGWEPLLTKTGVALGALIAPFAVLLALLLPVISGTSGFTPSAAQRSHDTDRYGDLVSQFGHWIATNPGAIAQAGTLVVAGLLVVPFALLASTRLWAALVVGGTLALLGTLVIPPAFTAAAALLSLSQARHLPEFLPIPFAVVGGCALLAPLRVVGVLVAGGLGAAFLLLSPGTFTYVYSTGGPGWVVWVAIGGGVIVLVVGAFVRTRGPDFGPWTVGTTAAFLVPLVVAGFMAFGHQGPAALPPGIVAAVRDDVSPGDVVFSDPETAYALAAFAPVYINDSETGHIADTVKNRIRARKHDTRRFLRSRNLSASARRAILARWKADWLLIDKRRPAPEDFLAGLRPIYEDRRFALYDLHS
jgi:hypothetical protein